MKLFLKINILILILINTSFANDKIVFLDINYVLSNSEKGKLILKQFDEKNKKNILELEKKENILKNKEKDLEIKKNILSENELNKQIEDLKVQIVQFKKEKDRMVKEFNIYKKKELSSLMQEMNPIISEYVKEKSIDLVLDKKIY